MSDALLLVGSSERLATLADLLESHGHPCTTVDADEWLKLGDPVAQVVLLDIDVQRDASMLLDHGKRRLPHASFLMVTSPGSIEQAVGAIDRGADGYLAAPFEAREVLAVVRRALEHARVAREAARLRDQLASPARFEQLVGDHPSMQQMFRTIAQVAKTRATVLVTGETGTGKELIASAIHYRSPRRDRPYVRLNCAALAESLLESELFGHERGAFTGATARRAGRFEQADGGTLFLDEVSEMPLALQVKLLRFLQEREFERVGSNETVRVDVRIIAATNKDLARLVEEGRFREDLHYRLDIVGIEVPPLRARPSDIPALAQHFLEKYAAENEVDIVGFEDDALQALVAYAWPGNVRELENVIERAVVVCEQARIGLANLPAPRHASATRNVNMFVPGLKLEELERIAILKTLEATGGSTKRAAELLGISRRKIQYRLKDWGVSADDTRQ